MDGTIPRNQFGFVLAKMQEMSQRHGLRVANVFHAGDGNLHPLILYHSNKPGDTEKAEEFGADILKLCVEVGGVLTGEHGVGVEKRDLMHTMFNEVDLAQQQRVKCAFDPNHRLNPGKVFPNSATLCRARQDARSQGQPALSQHPKVLTGMETLAPRDAREVVEVVTAAISNGTPLEVAGNGTKRGIGRPMDVTKRVSAQGLRGVSLYEPSELVLRAASGTPVREIVDMLAQQGQELAFEPMDHGPLFGKEPMSGTIGGLVAVNASGPRRIKSGAARDHLLGFRAVSGRADEFQSGGRVMKNVTGYDLLQAHGRLAWHAGDPN